MGRAMSIEFNKSQTGSFTDSADRITRGLAPRLKNIQSVWAFLNLAGFPPIQSGGYAGLSIGTRNINTSPAYLGLLQSAVWENGQAFVENTLIDAAYYDMTRSRTWTWKVGTNEVNVPIAYEELTQSGDIIPTTPPPTGYAYGPYGSPTIGLSADGTKGTIVWAAYDGRPGDYYYYALTITWTLSHPITYDQYAQVCAQQLSAVSLLSPNLIYTINSGYTGVGMPANKRKVWLDWHSNVPSAPTSPINVPTLPVGTIVVTNSRSGYVLYDTSIGPIRGGFGGSSNNYWPWWLEYSDFPTGPILQSLVSDARHPLAAYGVPFWGYHLTGPDAYFLVGLGINTVAQATAMNPPLDASVIYCVKSAVNTNRSLAPTGVNFVYSPDTNSYNVSPAAGLPSISGEYTFNTLSYIGLITANSQRIISVVVDITVSSNSPLNNSISVGVPVNIYCIGLDAHQVPFEWPTATWSFYSRSGGILPGDLVANGNYAVFTPSGAGTARIQANSGGLNGISGTLTVS